MRNHLNLIKIFLSIILSNYLVKIILAYKTETFNTIDVFKDGDYIFMWSINEANLTIKIELNVKTTEWIGFGISLNRDIWDSETYMCKYNSLKDQVICLDGWSVALESLPLNEFIKTANNLSDVTGSITTDLRTKISFTRKFNTGDVNDLKLERGKVINVMFIYNQNRKTELEKSNYLNQARYTTEKIVLDEYITSSSKIKAINDWTIEIIYDNYEIPEGQTSYICKTYDLNNLVSQQTGKDKNITYHAIKFEPIIDKENYVHHTNLFGCINDEIETKSEILPCEGNMPNGCSAAVYGWVPGQSSFNLPDEAGTVWGT